MSAKRLSRYIASYEISLILFLGDYLVNEERVRMKKKPTSDDDIVEWVVEEAFVKEEYKHRPNCNDLR